MWKTIRPYVLSILQNTTHHRAGGINEFCFISAYQIAVLLYKQNPGLLMGTNYQNIGGKKEGIRTSLSKLIANSLSRDIANNRVQNIEIGFFYTKELIKFNYRDEQNRIRRPSSTCFAIFRYIP